MGKFVIRGQGIEFDTKNIYFLTGLSHRGERPIMEGVRVAGETLDMLIVRVCRGACKSSTSRKLQILTVGDLTLRPILFMVTREVRSQAQHEVMKTQLCLALDCLTPTMYNWVDAVSVNMKRQLTKCQWGETK